MPRPVNIKLIMDVYKKLINNKCNKIAAEDLKISEPHVGRIANFLVSEFFLFNVSPLSNIRLYEKTKCYNLYQFSFFMEYLILISFLYSRDITYGDGNYKPYCK